VLLLHHAQELLPTARIHNNFCSFVAARKGAGPQNINTPCLLPADSHQRSLLCATRHAAAPLHCPAARLQASAPASSTGRKHHHTPQLSLAYQGQDALGKAFPSLIDRIFIGHITSFLCAAGRCMPPGFDQLHHVMCSGAGGLPCATQLGCCCAWEGCYTLQQGGEKSMHRLFRV